MNPVPPVIAIFILLNPYCQKPGMYVRRRISRMIPRTYKPPNKRICNNCGVENHLGQSAKPAGASFGRGWLKSLMTLQARPAARKTSNTVGEKKCVTKTRYRTSAYER